MNRPTVTRRMNAVLGGTAVAVLLGLALYAVLFLAELLIATRMHSPLPPPLTDHWPDWSIVAASTAVGFWRFMVILRTRGRHGPLFGSVIAAFASVAIIAFSAAGSTIAHETSYLSAFPESNASTGQLLEWGHKACDWLKQQNWGKPNPPITRGHLYPKPYAPRNMVITSTATLEAHYGRTGWADRVVLTAWYRLCPFQQWVHRPIGGGGND